MRGHDRKKGMCPFAAWNRERN